MKKSFILLLFIALSFINGKDLNSADSKSNYRGKSNRNFFQYISSLKLPGKLEFCGERVPLEIEEVRERAEREFYLLLQRPGQIILYIKRSGRYFPMFERILKQNKMPDDLKYLSVAESALYMARSPKNAVGLWQFIPSTAKKMGLIVNKYVDERRNAEKSTYAAVKYLKAGYKAHHSWLLAAAGYNMGHLNMQRHILYQNKNNYFDLFMNEETSRYILRIVIIKELMANAKKYGLVLNKKDLYKPYIVKKIKVKSIKDIASWAKAKGTSYKYVKLLNPWILKRKLPAKRNRTYYKVAIPKSRS